jgi:hypothetical protein
VLAIAVLHFSDDHGDSGCVDLGLLYERGGPMDIIGVDGVEELLHASDCGQLLKHEGAF